MINPILNKAVKYSGSLTFNGIDEYVLTTSRISQNDYATNKGCTIHCAFKLNTSPKTSDIFSLWDTINAHPHIRITINTSNILVFSINDGTDNIGITSSETFSTGVWYNVICTYDGSKSNSGMKFFRDGVELTNTAGVQTLSIDYDFNDERIFAGQWNARFADAYICNIALRPDKISDAMAIQLSRWKKKINYHGLTDFQYVYRLNSGTSIANEGYEGNQNDIGGSLSMNFTNVDATNESTDVP